MGNAYKALLRDAQAQLSHSRRGECYDNALPGTTQAESLWSRLKTEELEAHDWPVFGHCETCSGGRKRNLESFSRVEYILATYL